MQRNKGVACNEDHQMETKGKRSGRGATRSEKPVPQAAPAETSSQIPPGDARESDPVVTPSPRDVVVQRVSSLAPAISARRGEFVDFGSGALAAMEESRVAVARGFDALGEELAELARCGIDTVTRTAIEMLAVKTFFDAIAVNSSFARASFDNWIGGSAKFSELGVKLAVESSRPFLAHLGERRGFTAHPGGRAPRSA
jgi:Phasin protein